MTFLCEGKNMRIQSLFVVFSLVCGVTTLHAAPSNPSASFTLSTPVHVPGETLKKGDYTIQVLNRLSDRVILQVDDAKGKAKATFIGVPNRDIPNPAERGSVMWANPAGRGTYLKGWSFPDSPVVIEFVYPKAEAVSIATANPAKVPAVDPASEGKADDQNLSPDDMQLLTLWLLSLQQVGPGAPAGGIRAERYQLTASAEYRPSIKALPHTASLMPLVWMVGFCGIIMAFCQRRLRLMRRSHIKSSMTVGRG
jgi:hypothetical protein